MPDPISLAPYTQLQQPADQMKTLSSAASMMDTLAAVRMKQRELLKQTQTADIVKQATDANGVFHPEIAQRVAGDGNHPYAAWDMTQGALQAQNSQAVIAANQAGAKSAIAGLIAQQMIPYATATSMDPAKRRSRMKNVVSWANEHGMPGMGPDAAARWNRLIETTADADLPALAVQIAQQGLPVASIATPTAITEPSGRTATMSQAGAAQVLGAGGGAPAAPPPGSVSAGPAPTGGAPAAPPMPPPRPTAGVTAIEAPSPVRIATLTQGNADFNKFQQDTADVPQRIANLGEMLATKDKFAPGPASEEINYVRGLYSQMLNGMGLKTPQGDADALSAFNQFQKFARQYAINRGGATDEARISQLLSNPNWKMDPNAIGVVSHLMQGVEEGIKAKVDLGNRERSANPDTFDYYDFSNRFQQAYDPRVMALRHMKPAEVSSMITALKTDPAAMNDFKRSIKAMASMGIIDKAEIIRKLQSAGGP